MKEVLLQIISDLETTMIAVGGLAKILSEQIKPDSLMAARKQASKDIEKHFGRSRLSLARKDLQTEASSDRAFRLGLLASYVKLRLTSLLIGSRPVARRASL